MKSRIQALRQMNESAEDYVNYEGQSAYDVADMLKQYFRDLPEPLMTNKLSETFLQIYQCKHPGISLRLVALGLVGPIPSFQVILLTRNLHGGPLNTQVISFFLALSVEDVCVHLPNSLKSHFCGLGMCWQSDCIADMEH